MKHRLRFIFGLLASCLLGMYGFQAYWLYNEYQLARAWVTRAAHEALEVVVQRQQLHRASQVFYTTVNVRGGATYKLSAPPLIGGAAPLRLIRRSPGHPADNQPHRLPASVVVPAGPLPRFRADSLARQLSGLVISDWVRAGTPAVDLPHLTQAYRAELRRRGTELACRLDTLPARAVPVAAQAAGFLLHTPAVVLNPVRGPVVVASFQLPATYVLRYMTRGLVGSVLLLSLTTGCFALMLSTILSQKKLSEVKNDFINNMTHELKTPLATVSAAVEALQDFGALGDPRKTDAYLTMARQELTRLSDLVEKVLQIAVEERHGRVLALNPEPVRLAELVAEQVSRHQLHAAKPVEFDVAIGPTDTLWLDRLHLAGVLNNLFDNALKYSGERVRIRIQSQPQRGGWQLIVADDGFGIAPGYQAAVFDQFFRVPTGNLHPVKGFGLGLYYVRQIITGHGGRISLRSEMGRGSEFIIWLPTPEGVALTT